MTSAVPTATAFEYAGDGSTRAFSYPLRFLEAADLRVSLIDTFGTETLKTLGTHYAVGGAGAPMGGTVSFVSGQTPAAGVTVKVSRRTLPKQTVDLTDIDRTPGDTLELQLDRLTMAMQDLEQRFAEVETTPGPSGLNSFLFGDGAPVSGNGSDGDVYADRLNGDLYKKTSGAWVYQTNIIGPQGEQGEQGIQGDLGDFDADGTVARVTALEDTALKPGDAAFSFRKLAADPAGFLIVVADRTIGDGSSGADVADIRCADLFAALYADYSNTELPIQDSTGSPTTRGANAAADWAAHKRLPLPNPADRFLRFASGTRAAGLKEANQNKLHDHAATFTGEEHSHTTALSFNCRFGANHSGSSELAWCTGDTVFGSRSSTKASNGVVAGGTVDLESNGGSEARPDSFVVTCLLKL